jgi:hypothetical protein
VIKYNQNIDAIEIHQTLSSLNLICPYARLKIGRISL